MVNKSSTERSMTLTEFLSALESGRSVDTFPEKWPVILLENIDTLVNRRVFDIMRVMEYMPKLNTIRKFEGVHKWYELFDTILKHSSLMDWKDAFSQTSLMAKKDIFYYSYIIADDEFFDVFKKENKFRFMKKHMADIHSFLGYRHIVEYNTQHVEVFIKRCRAFFVTNKNLFMYYKTLLWEMNENMYHLSDLKPPLVKFYNAIVPYIIRLIKRLPRLSMNELYGTDIFIDMTECVSSPELADQFIQRQLKDMTSTQWKTYLQHAAIIDTNIYAPTESYSGSFIRALRRNNISSYVELLLYETAPDCVVLHDIHELSNLLIMDIRNNKLLFENTILETITEDSIYCLQHLIDSFETIYHYEFGERFIRNIIKEIAHKPMDKKRLYIRIIKNFIPEFELHLLTISGRWLKYVSYPVVREIPTERCVVSYEIPQGFFRKCMSNVPHIVSLEVYVRLQHKHCPYCRHEYDDNLFHPTHELESRE